MDASSVASKLFDSVPLIAPSLLAADFADLEGDIRRLEEAGAQVLHLDIMDGHFVPNISFGIPVVEAIRRTTDLPLDVHLMIAEPTRYLHAFRDAGADLLTIHVEAVDDPAPVLEEIRSLGASPGISLNPPTPLQAVEPYLDACDIVLVMSVMPGFGGQEFQEVALEKMRRLRTIRDNGLLISVDGGVNLQTIESCARAGANFFVTGTALLGHANYSERLERLRTLAQSGADTYVSEN
jgi:ribulose-phosphate 3-epimerase